MAHVVSARARAWLRHAAAAGAASLALLVLPAVTEAQIEEVELDQSTAAELYIRKRPPVPEAPKTPRELKVLLEKTEKARNDKRLEAISLLREFLNSKPTGEARAEGLFKLAELLWEEARRQFILAMDRYERDLEACRVERKACKKKPEEPRLNLDEPAGLYKEILANHPGFRRTDLVLYLVGFAAQEKGRQEESLGYFNQVIARFPDSPLYGDSWMMIGEHHFAATRWEDARKAYSNILSRPEAATFDLALFKTAWCDWKLGEVETAARRFKQVLDLAVEAEASGSARTRRRRAQLRDEALEYLVIVFTEDKAITAKEVYEFLASIGGERYSKDVLLRVADAYYTQSEYERSVNTYQFLIGQDPTSLEAANYQRRIVEAYNDSLDQEKTVVELKVLVDTYGPESEWAKANQKYPSRLSRSIEATEALVRQTATNFHAEAQRTEKSQKKANVDLYRRAASAYEVYLGRFSTHERGPEVRFLRAEILYFKLGQLEAAGDEYLAVAKTEPKSAEQKDKLHKDALLKAMDAYEKARPKNVGTGQKRELLPVDRKFAEAVDLYATLFPADPELVGVIFRNGQLFYDYGDYDEAIKRFGLIVTKYPNDPNAGPAGDRILKALAQGEDYENIEEWARKLKKAAAFQSADQQARLDRLIIESISKSGEKYANAGEYDKAAKFYLRIPKEFPKHELAAPSYMNAGVVYEKSKRPELAAAVYIEMATAFPKAELAAKAAFTAGKVYEAVAYFDKAADAYELVVNDFERSTFAVDALFNAGVLRQALGQYDRAIKHYNAYATRYRQRKDADAVAFRIGVVYEEGGDDKNAYEAYEKYAREHRRSDGPDLIEAHTRAGRTALRLGRIKAAADHLKTALKLHDKAKRKPKLRAAMRPWAAEARYHQGELIFREFQAITLEVKPRKLRKTLDTKAKLLEKAQTAYLDVVDYGDSQWATAALFRMGQVFEGFAGSLRNAPVPPGLSAEEAEMYKMELENYVVEVEEQAIEVYKTGYEKALSLKVYNQYTRNIREALGRLDSASFPPIVDARGRERFGDRPITPRLVTEVVRDE